jgi:hypothetical protein
VRVLANDVAHTNDAATKDPGPQSASVYEEADNLWICVPRESSARLAQVQAFQFCLTDEEPFLEKIIQVHAYRDQIPARLVRFQRQLECFGKRENLFAFDECDLIVGRPPELGVGVTISSKPAIRHSLDRVKGDDRLAAAGGNENVLDRSHGGQDRGASSCYGLQRCLSWFKAMPLKVVQTWRAYLC